MFFERVRAGEGNQANQTRRIQVDVTNSVPGDTVIKNARGNWVVAPAEAGTDGPAITQLRTRMSTAEQAITALTARVQALEAQQIVVEVGSDSAGYTRVTTLRINTETGDVTGSPE